MAELNLGAIVFKTVHNTKMQRTLGNVFLLLLLISSVSHCWVMVAPAATTSRMMGHRHEARLTTKLAAGVEDPTSRRKFLDTVVIAAGLATTVSAAVSAPANAFDRKEDKFSYTINIPTTMKQSQKPVKTHQDEINFASEDIKGYQYGITVDPVRINSLKEVRGAPQVRHVRHTQQVPCC